MRPERSTSDAAQPDGDQAPEQEEFGELLRYTAAGYLGGLFLGVGLDAGGMHRSPVGQWLVRTLAGEGESLLEGVYALRRRLRRGRGSLAEAYGWGKMLGMAIPWMVDWVSRLLGVHVYGVLGFYIPYFYAMTDQIGGNVSGLVHFRRRTGSWGAGLAVYLRHPVMLSGLAVILAVPAGLLGARLAGFSPTTQVRTAAETIAANLCWLPPAIGWWSEHRRGKGSRTRTGES